MDQGGTKWTHLNLFSANNPIGSLDWRLDNEIKPTKETPTPVSTIKLNSIMTWLDTNRYL